MNASQAVVKYASQHILIAVNSSLHVFGTMLKWRQQREGRGEEVTQVLTSFASLSHSFYCYDVNSQITSISIHSFPRREKLINLRWISPRKARHLIFQQEGSRGSACPRPHRTWTTNRTDDGWRIGRRMDGQQRKNHTQCSPPSAPVCISTAPLTRSLPPFTISQPKIWLWYATLWLCLEGYFELWQFLHSVMFPYR